MGELITAEQDLLEKEAAYIRAIRVPNTHADQPAGLAISGGGIRSASFALGALQALENVEALEKFDYMSTVSGGGYIGSCLTWFMDMFYRASLPGLKNFLGKKDRGARSFNSHDILGYLRQHGKYLTPSPGLDLISALGVVLRGMLLGLFVYFPPLAGLFYLLLKGCAWLVGKGIKCPVQNIFPAFPGACVSEIFLFLAVLCLAIFALAAVFYSFGTFAAKETGNYSYRHRRWSQENLGNLLRGIILSLAIASIPFVAHLLTATIDKYAAALVAGTATLSSYLLGISKFVLETRKAPVKDSKLTGYLIPIAALLLIYGLLLSAFVVGQDDFFRQNVPLLHLLILGLSLLLAWCVNLNYISPHRMYRDRLMEMFLPEIEAVCSDTWQPAKEANSKALQSFAIDAEQAAKAKYPGPYHIINTNLILVAAEDAKFRGRGGDSFILTPLYCGSNATGWRDTGSFNNGNMTLATAMAISGAAANPHAGPDGAGPTRNVLFSFLMSFFNISLGYWAGNPRRELGRSGHKANYVIPGLRQGLLGRGYNEKANFIELTDGGHFENLALYELIRRRVRTIIVTDGGADLDFNFSDLANAVEKVRVDFGVIIDFAYTNNQAPICDLLPNSGEEKSLYKAKYSLAKRGYAEGRIIYPETTRKDGQKELMVGRIIYIKATLTGGLPEDIYGYKSGNPDFPNQTTADQFFDEGQFEAYRELGYQLTKRMLAETGVL